MVNQLVSAKLLLLDAGSNALVLRRSSTHPRHAHAADLPGGVVETGEQPLDALGRELAEETGITLPLENAVLLHSVTDWYEDTGEGAQSVVRLTYGLRLPRRAVKVTVSWEHEDAQWLPVQSLEAHEFRGAFERAVEYILEKDLWRQL